MNGKPFKELTIGIPKETHAYEKSVSIGPEAVEKLVEKGFKVKVEKDAGEESFITNDMFRYYGASISDAFDVFGSDIIVKTHPPCEEEIEAMSSKSILFSGYPNNYHESLLYLYEKKIPVYNTNLWCNKAIYRYSGFFKSPYVLNGFVWEVINEIALHHKKPLHKHNEGKKVNPAIKVFNAGTNKPDHFISKILSDMGAVVYTLEKIPDEDFAHDFSIYDVVVTPILPGGIPRKFYENIIKNMKKGALFVDIHNNDITNLEETAFEGNTEKEEVKIVGINFSRIFNANESASKLRGTIFYNVLVGLARSPSKLDLNIEILKDTVVLPEKKPGDVDEEEEKFLRDGNLSYREELILKTGSAVFLLSMSYLMYYFYW